MKSLDMIKGELSDLYEKSRMCVSWEFNENAEDAEEQAKDCLPGRLVCYLYDLFDDKAKAIRAIGLLTAFNVRRSLACWFLYCINERPRNIAFSMVEFWLSPDADVSLIDESWLNKTVAIDAHGGLIQDCRSQDTDFVNGAIALATKFALERKLVDAIDALCWAWSAWELSPAGGYDHDLDIWSYKVAAPCAAEMREMTSEEQLAFGNLDMLICTGHTLGSVILGEINPEEVVEKMIRYGIPF